jgi:molybdopterin-guanine dinucleotide biosynthesis protein A
MLDVEAFILVGGKSTRMGQDKSQLLLAGETMVERLARELSKLTQEITLVGARSEPPKGLENISDVHPDWGALGGIHSALHACQAKWAAIVACDLPFVTGEMVSHLLQLANDNDAAPFDAVVPIQTDQRPQPLCGIYQKGPCLKVTETLIAIDEHTPRALLARVRTRWVSFEEIATIPGAENFFLNVNTPADYDWAKRLLGDPPSGTGAV